MICSTPNMPLIAQPHRRSATHLAVAGILLSVATLARAAGTLDELCPNATAALAATAFPENVPPSVNKGSVEVNFSIRADGSVFDAAIYSSTDPSFNDSAIAAVSKLSCAPQVSNTRLRLPLGFSRPLPVTSNICPNFQSVMRKLGYPKAAFKAGIEVGEVIVDFNLTAQGEITEFYVIRSTHESFTAVAVQGLARLKCNGVGRELRIRVPFEFRIE